MNQHNPKNYDRVFRDVSRKGQDNGQKTDFEVYMDLLKKSEEQDLDYSFYDSPQGRYLKSKPSTMMMTAQPRRQ